MKYYKNIFLLGITDYSYFSEKNENKLFNIAVTIFSLMDQLNLMLSKEIVWNKKDNFVLLHSLACYNKQTRQEE